MVARRTSSAGFVAGARPDGVSGFVRRADFYAKLPSELAEGSVIGGLVSIICTMAFVWLFVAQFKSYNTVGTRTDIVVDHEADKSFQVNFKIELPELSCEWATVDVVDSLGARRFNISGEQLYKHALGSDHYLGVEHASVTAGNSGYEVDTDGTDVDHYGNARIAYEITGATFERMVKVGIGPFPNPGTLFRPINLTVYSYTSRSTPTLRRLKTDTFLVTINKAHRVLLINFHAPWCSHCQALAPVFEHAAELVRDDLKEHKKQRLAAGVATVDCTLDRNKKLCAAQQIQAFPSLRLYRAGESYGVKQPNASSKGKAAGKGQLQFEAYHGDRSAEAIAAYVHEALDETLHEADAKHESSYDDDEGKARAASATKKAAVAAGARKALGGLGEGKGDRGLSQNS